MGNEQGNLHGLVAVLTSAIAVLLGVDYYALIWSFIGSLIAVSQVPSIGRFNAVLKVAGSTLVGAAIGNGIVVLFASSPNTRPLNAFFSLCCGFGSQTLLVTGVSALVTRMKNWGEKS